VQHGGAAHVPARVAPMPAHAARGHQRGQRGRRVRRRQQLRGHRAQRRVREVHVHACRARAARVSALRLRAPSGPPPAGARPRTTCAGLFWVRNSQRRSAPPRCTPAGGVLGLARRGRASARLQTPWTSPHTPCALAQALCARRVSFSQAPTGRFPGCTSAPPRGAAAGACLLRRACCCWTRRAGSHRARNAVSAERVPAAACAKLTAEASASCG